MDENCSQTVSCRYFDPLTSKWRSDGLAATHDPANGRLSCASTHLTTFAGVLSLPTSVEELVAELCVSAI